MNRDLQKLSYEWPPNLTQYEAAVFLGLTAVEAMAGMMAFLIPLTLLDNKIAGAVLGVVLLALTVGSLKKLESFGNVSLPVYMWKRWRAARHKRTLYLTQIMGVEHATVHIEDPDGHTITIE